MANRVHPEKVPGWTNEKRLAIGMSYVILFIVFVGCLRWVIVMGLGGAEGTYYDAMQIGVLLLYIILVWLGVLSGIRCVASIDNRVLWCLGAVLVPFLLGGYLAWAFLT